MMGRWGRHVRQRLFSLLAFVFGLFAGSDRWSIRGTLTTHRVEVIVAEPK